MLSQPDVCVKIMISQSGPLVQTNKYDNKPIIHFLSLKKNNFKLFFFLNVKKKTTM
jgi:hypothetical protein